MDPAFLTIAELAGSIAQRELSPVEVTKEPAGANRRP